MVSFNYTITDDVGIHARPAGALAKKAKEFSSKIIIKSGGRSAEATRLIAVMGLGAKKGTEITLEISGSDEAEAAEDIKKFLEANL